MNKQVATFGGGCFWCIEAIVQRLEGVTEVISGYSGGATTNPNYRAISTGNTGHAEVVQVTFDSDIISYEDLITIFMTSHDPTTPDRQGADRGTQYRSIILYHDAKQKQTVDMVLKSLKSSFPNSIVTEVAPLEAFYNAEIYHQNYFNSNSTAGYCRVVIDPKIKKIREKYADKLKKEMMD